MSNLEFCCNPFKQRNHKPALWLVLPVTKSLSEQFRLYLGDATDICISCKRKLYDTLPDDNNVEQLNNDFIFKEMDESFHWSDDMNLEVFNETRDYLSVEKDYLTYELPKERQTELRITQQPAIKSENISKSEATSTP